MKLKLYIDSIEDFSEVVLSEMKKKFNVTIGKTSDSVNYILKTYDVYWLRFSKKLISSDFPLEPRCKFIVTPVTCADHIDYLSCKKHKIKLLTLKGEVDFLRKVRATAELTVGLILNSIRHIGYAQHDVQNNCNWNRDKYRGTEIYNKTIGIVGYGRLGQIVSEILIAFGAKIIYCDLPNKNFKKIKNISRVNLYDLANQSDIISIHLSQNHSTHNLINKDFFNNCKKKVLIVNTSRGSIVNEDDLIEFLEKNPDSKFAADVIKDEFNNGINKWFNLIKQKKVTLTPHIGGNTYESFFKTENFMYNKLIQNL